ncbi:MAG: carbon-nitrogen hydrolase family protein [Limisphaerales bacterium]|jgi:predicted amidohydrolase
MKAPETLQVSCTQLHWTQPIERNLQRTLLYLGKAAEERSRVAVFPETGISSYDFPYALTLKPSQINDALKTVCQAVREAHLWAIVGTLKPTRDRFINLACVINPSGKITYEYAKVHMAGRDEQRYCRGGNKIAWFEIDGIPCTMAICRDGRHPELYRIPAMAGAKILFQPSCSSDEVEAVWWKRISGRAQQPAGPNSRIFHCVANTIGTSSNGKQSTSGQSFIRDPNGLPLAEAGPYQEEMITATLDLSQADRSYARDSLANPPFLRKHWQAMIRDMKARAHLKPR